SPATFPARPVRRESRPLSSGPTRRYHDATAKLTPISPSVKPPPRRTRKLSSGHARVASRAPFVVRCLNRASGDVVAGAEPTHAFDARIYRLTTGRVARR